MCYRLYYTVQTMAVDHGVRPCTYVQPMTAQQLAALAVHFVLEHFLNSKHLILQSFKTIVPNMRQPPQLQYVAGMCHA